MTLIVGILLTLLFSAIFSGTEIAFITASKVKIELLRKKETRRAQYLSNFYENPSSFLGAMLVGNNIALVSFSLLMSALLTPLLTSYIQNEPLLLFLTTIVTTIVVLIFGEFLPKTIFSQYASNIMYLFAVPLRMINAALKIPAWIMIKLSNALLYRLFGLRETLDRPIFTRADLEKFVISSSSQNGDTTNEDFDADLFENALQFKNLKVRECMVPRKEIEHIDITDSIEQLRQQIIETNLSRIIVINDSIDDILGYVHHQHLFTEPKDLKSIILDVVFVPEAMRIQDLMHKFIQERMNIACVVDEFGGTAGIITMEDILEELFGEIEDEHDQEEHYETIVQQGEYIFSGRLEIDYLNDKYDELNLPEGDYNTLSGYLVTSSLTIPEQGEEIELGDYFFTPELVSDTKIEMIRVKKKSTSDNEVV